MYTGASTTEYAAMAAGGQGTSCARYTSPHCASQSIQAMRGTAARATHLIQTGVSASVSLFVLLIIVGNFLLTSLVGWLSLRGLLGLVSLSGLTGLVISLVGLVKGLSPGTNAGD